MLVALAVIAAGWILPGALALAMALHLQDDHDHPVPHSTGALESLLHGHFHDSQAPEHEHSVQIMSGSPGPQRAGCCPSSCRSGVRSPF